jgi:hypothetical protein
VRWIMRVLSPYGAVGWRKVGGQEEGGNDNGTSMTLVTGDVNGEGEVMGCGHFREEEGEEVR